MLLALFQAMCLCAFAGIQLLSWKTLRATWCAGSWLLLNWDSSYPKGQLGWSGLNLPSRYINNFSGLCPVRFLTTASTVWPFLRVRMTAPDASYSPLLIYGCSGVSLLLTVLLQATVTLKSLTKTPGEVSGEKKYSEVCFTDQISMHMLLTSKNHVHQ